MRFLDYNGDGRIDPQDVTTSIVVEEATREDTAKEKPSPQQLSGNAGCSILTAMLAFSVLLISLAH